MPGILRLSREPVNTFLPTHACNTRRLTFYTPQPSKQAMARKLRIFAGPEHGLEGKVELVPLDMPPRALRVKGPVLELEEGFEPFNPEAYYKRFGHRLAAAKAGQ